MLAKDRTDTMFDTSVRGQGPGRCELRFALATSMGTRNDNCLSLRLLQVVTSGLRCVIHATQFLPLYREVPDELQPCSETGAGRWELI